MSFNSSIVNVLRKSLASCRRPVDLLDQDFSFSSFSGKNGHTLCIKQTKISVQRCFLTNLERERESDMQRNACTREE
jgi:hypothetical protein